MDSLAAKLLIFGIVMLLSLSPLQGVMGAAVAAPTQDSAVQHGSDCHGGDMVDSAVIPMEHACAHALGDAACNGGDCASSHCGFCAVGLVSLFSAALPLVTDLEKPPVNTGLVNQIASSLYRPPRG